MKKNTTKTAKTVGKKEVKKVAPKKTVAAPAAKPAEPAIDANTVRLMKKEIDDYKMTVGLLEAKVEELQAANLKAKKRISALNQKLAKAKEGNAQESTSDVLKIVGTPLKTTPIAPAPIGVPMSPTSPFSNAAPSPDVVLPSVTPIVPVAIPPVSPDFIKSCKAVRY